MNYIETSGKTVEDAVLAAALKLGIPSDQVEYEILQEGSKGVLGIFGAKEFRIRALAKTESLEDEIFGDMNKPSKPAAETRPAAESRPAAKPAAKPAYKPAPAKEAPKKEAPRKESVKEAPKAENKPAYKPAAKPAKVEKEAEKIAETPVQAAVKEEPKQTYVVDTLVEDRLAAARARAEKEAEEANKPKEPIAFSEDALKAQDAAKAFLIPLLKKMGIEDVEINGEMEEEDVLCLSIVSKDLGVIIGKRGNTLDSLQYLTALVANRNIDGHVKIKLDAENYREKRKETLEKLAVNLARKAKKTGRRVTLEPMNPYERRIIHSVLQDFNGVDTHSEGEEPYRKVVITPVKGNYRRHK